MNFSSKLEIEMKNDLQKASYLALSVSLFLCVIKYANYLITGSSAIHASALDSFMDIAISSANFIAIYFTTQSNKQVMFGYDKIASLFSFIQGLLICALALHIIYESFYHCSHDHSIENIEQGMIVLIVALILSILLVLYQNKIVKKHKSIIIKVDMIHFISDIFTNLSILIGFIFIKFFNIYWLDPVLGIAVGVYLMFSIYDLLKNSILSLLDFSDQSEAHSLNLFLTKHNFNFQPQNVNLLFSGVKHIAYIKIDNENIKNAQLIKNLIEKHKDQILNCRNNCHKHSEIKNIEVKFLLDI